MSNVMITNIKLISQNPAKFTDPLLFEISFESLKTTKECNVRVFLNDFLSGVESDLLWRLEQ